MEIRPATPEDAAGIAAVQIAAWRHNFEDVVDPRIVASLEPEAEVERWTTQLQTSVGDRSPATTYVVELGGRTVGFAVLTNPGQSTGELRDLYVHPVAQGAGLGSQLLGYAERTLHERGASGAATWLLARNDHGRAFLAARKWSRDTTTTDVRSDDHPLGPTERWIRQLG